MAPISGKLGAKTQIHVFIVIEEILVKQPYVVEHGTTVTCASTRGAEDPCRFLKGSVVLITRSDLVSRTED